MRVVDDTCLETGVQSNPSLPKLDSTITVGDPPFP
jgi:hypothetical protein